MEPQDRRWYKVHNRKQIFKQQLKREVMIISMQDEVGKVVALNYNTAAVFKKSGIDYCCNGQRSIAAACEELSLDADMLLQQLNDVLASADRGSAPAVDYASWPPDLLADYIQKMHHRYVRAQIPTITQLLEKISRVHAAAHPELANLKNLFATLSLELLQHLNKEEQVLFPYIRKMVALQESEAATSDMGPAFVQHPLRVMMQEHDEAGGLFRKINEVSNGYSAPADACNTYRAAFKALSDFEQDLHLHIHLENNILFPAALKLEQQLISTD